MISLPSATSCASEMFATSPFIYSGISQRKLSRALQNLQGIALCYLAFRGLAFISADLDARRNKSIG